MEQNLMSLAGSFAVFAFAPTPALAAAPAVASALNPLALPCLFDTAFIALLDTVDFSAYVALVVRK